MRGAEIVINTLLKHKVDIAFGYIGGSVLDLFDEFRKNKDKIKLLTTASEQGACHAADGYARAGGKTGVVIATSGPGATNLVTGIATAFMDSVPLVVITGNVSRSLIGKDSFQEVDIVGITMPITKHNFLVSDIDKLEDILDEAFMLASSGRPAPVLVDIPKDIFSADSKQKNEKEAKAEFLCFKKVPKKLTEQDYMMAETLIANSTKPFIYVGGGVERSRAGDEIAKLSERINAPIGASLMGLSAIDNGHPNYVGLIGMHGLYGSSEIMSEADLIIAVGTRFSDRATGDKEKFYKNRKVLHIDIDPSEIGKNIPAYFSLIGDAKEILNRLLHTVVDKDCEEWKERVQSLRADNEKYSVNSTGLSPRLIIETTRKYANSDTVIATDVGQHQIWVAQYYKFNSPKTFLTPGGLGTMGYGTGGAIGACISTCKRSILFTGDGSFLMNMNELATAVAYNLPIIIIIMNNSSLGMVKQWQQFFKKGKTYETEPIRHINFAKVAEAMGAIGLSVDNVIDLERIMKKAFSINSPVIIEVKIDANEKVLPIIPPEKGLEDIILRG